MCQNCNHNEVATTTEMEEEIEEIEEEIEEEEELPLCSQCLDPTDQSELNDYDNMCESCREDHFTCEDCDNLHHNDDMNTVYITNTNWRGGETYEQIVCDDCCTDHYSRCYHCRNQHHHTRIAEVGGNAVCHTCIGEHYYTCDECGSYIHNSEACSDSDDNGTYCPDCVPQSSQSNLIHGYSHKPYTEFFNTVDDVGKEYFGWELEADQGDSLSDDVIRPVHDLIGDYVYFKEDGSLGDNGFEMVSHPASFAYHMSRKEDFAHAFKHLLDNNFRSHQAETCGLHVHISREAFGDDENKRMYNMSRLMFLVEKFHDQVYKLSRRSEEKMARWAQRYGLEPTDIPEEMYTKKANHNNSSKGRYYILNFQNTHTVEMRAFRGSLLVDTFIATLQFVKSLTDISNSSRDLNKMGWEDFKKCVEVKKHKELMDYMKERGV